MNTGYDIEQLLQEALSRWLKPAEVLFILQNHVKFRICSDAPAKPTSGSVFLFNRSVVQFRKDGHNWRKKKDGRTVGEAHERIKVDYKEALNCYYAHGEDNPAFQRRSYWMLDPAYEHIVLVHYRDITEGNKKSEPSFVSPFSELDGSCQSLSSTVSVEVSSGIVADSQGIEQFSTVDREGKVSTSTENEVSDALQRLEQQLSLDDDKSKEHLPFASSLMYACYSPQTASDTNIPCYYPFLPESSHLQKPLGADSSLTIAQEQKFKIREISPEWGFANEFTKVIIIGSSISNPADCSLACIFGDIEVPVEIIQDGVLCCQAPPCHSGKVTFCIISSNKEPCSEVRAFKYVDKHINPQQEDRKSSDELMLVVRLGQMLFSDSTMQKREGKDLQMDPHRRHEDHEDSWGLIMDAILTGSEPSCGIMDKVVEELMKDKLQQWISSRSLNGNDNLVCVLSKKEKEILHIIAGLGYEWALSSILASGVGVNFRDTNGWTALHWAARFGREKMVAALMAYGASPGAFTYPTEHDPIGKIPASIALVCGHNGLSGYLSEQQAAARIQSFFRANSFMKRQLRKFATSGSGMDDIQGPSEASKLVLRPIHGYNIAALSIQKNYRSLKRRKDYLSLRQKVVKIQAHIRGYQTRKKYKFCRDVGIYDKIVLRRQKVAGRRGYRPKAMSINKEKEDEGILKSFRKRKVDVASWPEVELGILANVMESTSQSDILTMDNDKMYLGQGKGAPERSEIQKLVVKKEAESPKLSSQELPRERDEDTMSSDIIQNEMKDCCSIFFLLSRDYEFEKDILIGLWMAGGCINNEPMELNGQKCFDFLLREGYIGPVRFFFFLSYNGIKKKSTFVLVMGRGFQ